MSRRSRHTEETFTLFPFLAVLLCTMGTLTMIFVAVAQKGSDEIAVAQDVDDEGDKNVDFDPDAGLGDVAQYGRLVDAKALTAQLDRNRLTIDRDVEKFSALEELDETDETENTEQETPQDAAPEDEYELALLATDSMALEDVKNELESLEWFAEELKSIRSRTDSALESERARLANAEAALARLRADMEVSKQKYEMLAADDDSLTDRTAVELQDRINALDMQIEELNEETSKLREKSKDAKRSYAIVPYQGKKGTFRRPIFVECCADGVFIRPENVRFNEADFLVARYPGNPFDAALRAASRHYLDTLGTKTKNGDLIEPYPLLVVRPGGSKYFYLALAALASWGDRYGYEFVGEEQPIEYPVADPTLKTLLTEQIDSSRARLAAQLAEARAIQNAVDRRMAFGAGRSGSADSFFGSFAGMSGPTTELQSLLGSSVRVGSAKVDAPANGGARGVGGATGTPVGGMNAQNGAALANNGGNNAASVAATSQPGSALDGRNDYGAWAPQYNGAYSQFMTTSPSNPANANAEQAPESSAQAQGSALADAGTAEGFDPASGFDAQQGKKEQLAQAESVKQAAQAGTNAEGSQYAQAAAMGAETQYIPNASASASTANMPGYMQNMVASDASSSASSSNVDIRKTLGNTAYANNAAGSVSEGSLSAQKEQELPKKDDDMPKEAFRLSQEKPVTSGNERAILARCEANKIVFPKQAGVRNVVSIDCVSAAGKASRDKNLLDAIAYCVKSWGVAGRNSYWAPFVKVEVRPDGEERFRELSEFCERQGLAIVRVKTDESVK